MIRQAYAKVNLTLEVLGKRADGYHEIRSVFRTIALHDTLYFEQMPDLRVECSLPELSGTENLSYRAAHLLQVASGYQGGAHLLIEKAIPIAAGLGGGSSDGAAALLGLNELWQIHLPSTDLIQLAAELGSDVPFFLLGGTAVAEGRGEKLRPLPSLPNCIVLLVRPPIAVSTAAIYRMVTADAYSDGAITARFVALALDAPSEAWPLFNALQPFTCRSYPVVAEVLLALAGWGATRALMCGSGPTCFGLFADEETARDAATQAHGRGWDAWMTRFL